VVCRFAFKMKPPNTVHFIINPISGSRRSGAVVDRVSDELSAAGVQVRTFKTEKAGHGIELAKQAVSPDRVVVAVGGDGTVREVITGLMGSSTPMTIIPAGTENVIARHFAIPRNPTKLADWILRGQSRPIDVPTVNDQPFMMCAGIGWDGEAVARLARIRTGHITKWTYFRPIWDTFWQHKFPVLCIKCTENTVFDGKAMVFVGNIPRYALGLCILKHAIPDDGAFDVCVFPCESRMGFVGHCIRTVLGIHVGRCGVIYMQTKSLEVTSADEVDVQSDGDAFGSLPVRFSIKTGAILFKTAPKS
jgi:diacylglycerol kinase (ATP)